MPHCENHSVPHASRRASVFTATIFTKFSHLFPWKMITTVATRCQILRLKCTKFNFGCGSAQTPLGELIRCYSDPYSWIKVPTTKVREGTKERGGD